MSSTQNQAKKDKKEKLRHFSRNAYILTVFVLALVLGLAWMAAKSENAAMRRGRQTAELYYAYCTGGTTAAIANYSDKELSEKIANTPCSTHLNTSEKSALDYWLLHQRERAKIKIRPENLK